MHEGVPPVGECAENYDGPIPAVVHLHGGDVPPEIDGGPDAWFTSDGLHQGHGYYSFPGTGGPGSNTAVYRYPNTQEAGADLVPRPHPGRHPPERVRGTWPGLT